MFLLKTNHFLEFVSRKSRNLADEGNFLEKDPKITPEYTYTQGTLPARAERWYYFSPVTRIRIVCGRELSACIV